LAFYIAKITFCTAFWLLLTITYTFVRLRQSGDPSYDALDDTAHYKMFSYALIVFTAVFCGWFSFYAMSACGNVKKMDKGNQFVFAFTILMVVLVMVSMGIGAMYPLPSASLEFMLYYGMTNVYVWAMSYAYAPVDANAARFEELDDDREGAGLSIGGERGGGGADMGGEDMEDNDL
jgi:hypothetical protein